MQRSKQSKPLIKSYNNSQISYTPEKDELLKLLSSYIKGSARRDTVYTSLIELKVLVSK
jgi:hypothetical protein